AIEEGKHSVSSSSFIVIARINLVEDFDITTAGVVNADADDQIYLGSESTLSIDQLEAGDAAAGAEARVKSGDSILRAAGATHAFRASDLVLEAGTGTIGTSSNVIQINLVGGVGVLTARADDDVCVTETVGNLRIGSVFANSGGAYLSTEGG